VFLRVAVEVRLRPESTARVADVEAEVLKCAPHGITACAAPAAWQRTRTHTRAARCVLRGGNKQLTPRSCRFRARLLKSEDLPYADGPLNLPLDEHPFLATHVEAMHIVDTGARACTHEKAAHAHAHARKSSRGGDKNAPALLQPRARAAPAPCRAHASRLHAPAHNAAR
jgi:hypothetical protein